MFGKKCNFVKFFNIKEMKRLFVLIASSLLALPVFAQHEASPSSVYTSPNGVFSFDMANHVSWGYDFVKSDDFNPRGSGEVTLNVLGMKLYPSPYFGIETGLDCKWQYFGTRENEFYLEGADRLPMVMSWPAPGMGKADWHDSSLGVFSLSVPVFAKAYLGKVWIGGGAEANFNLTAYTEDIIEVGNTRTDVSMTKGKVNRFTYDFVGMLGYKDVALFAKFYPKNSTFVPEGGVKFNYWTLGVAVFL